MPPSLHSIGALAGVAVAVLIGACGAAAAQAAAPVTINACAPILDKNSQQTLFGIPVTSDSSGIRIEFVNDAPKAASVVNFAVNSNGETFVIRDVGTCSPGVSIVHQYRKGAGQAFVLPALIGTKITCSVQSVKFADGTVWPHGAPPAGGLALTATPARLMLDPTSDGTLVLVTSPAAVATFREIDDCNGIARITVGATAQNSAAFSVAPLGTGRCTITVTDDDGRIIRIPLTTAASP